MNRKDCSGFLLEARDAVEGEWIPSLDVFLTTIMTNEGKSRECKGVGGRGGVWSFSDLLILILLSSVQVTVSGHSSADLFKTHIMELEEDGTVPILMGV